MHVCSVPAGRYISLYSFLSRFNCMNSRAYMSSLQTGSQGGRKIIRRAPRKAKRLGFPGAYSQVMACSISMYCTMWFELTCNDWYYFRNKIEISNDKSHCNAYYTQLPFFKKNLKFLIFEIGFHQFMEMLNQDVQANMSFFSHFYWTHLTFVIGLSYPGYQRSFFRTEDSIVSGIQGTKFVGTITRHHIPRNPRFH